MDFYSIILLWFWFLISEFDCLKRQLSVYVQVIRVVEAKSKFCLVES